MFGRVPFSLRENTILRGFPDPVLHSDLVGGPVFDSRTSRYEIYNIYIGLGQVRLWLSYHHTSKDARAKRFSIPVLCCVETISH